MKPEPAIVHQRQNLMVRHLLIALFIMLFVSANAYRTDTITTDSSQLQVIFQTSQEVQDMKDMQRQMVLPAPKQKAEDNSQTNALTLSIMTACVLGLAWWWRRHPQNPANRPRE